MTLEKITKTQLKSIAKKEGEIKVWLCPSKCYPNPSNPFNVAIEKLFTKDDILTEKFEKYLSNFKYYNCDKETGNTVHYYRIVA